MAPVIETLGHDLSQVQRFNRGRFFQPRPIDRSLTDFSRQRRRVAVERRQGFIIDVFHSRLGLAMVEHQFTAI